MSSVKIIYKEPEDRPIERVEWSMNSREYRARAGKVSLLLRDESSAELVQIPFDEAEEVLRAILKMVEQRHG